MANQQLSPQKAANAPVKKNIVRNRVEPVLFNTFNTVFMIFLVIVTLYPFLNTIAVSFNAGNDTIRGGIYLLPREWTLQNYKAVFASGTIYNAFWITVARTVLSTVLNIFLTTMLAYTLSRREYAFRKPITLVFVLTMYFNAGLIPGYFLIKDLNLLNSFWVYILPSMVSAFNLIVIRTYIGTLPESLVESARIDGAGDFKIFMQIIFPLCKPVLATIALFVAVGAWNTWFDAFLYTSSTQKLSTLQYELMKLLSSSMNSNSNPNVAAGAGMTQDSATAMVTPLSIRAAVTVVASVPILVVYPFLQKYFVVGLNVGSVKE
ncbi:binding-protein-dependent transport systems inner membrane component [Paenibacillus vortex V453]|jgi:putative aldouronate transport system permease protein|uniref:Sugar ABC transporter permease n=2 Tax=Paenibacillus TaxID=44249 RepID=A0A163K324_9BACL|nr:MULTISPECIES: carbohydrate ABC transporter permease [Paenibacillus]ANA80945.1 sugar ABC transporter permease [Paenibacillus glucanolyticus]AVV54982.1 carbohydrate ABC transporter permease [Paenibacillus glucanolyticus]AWP29568.1 sugar ABC transporter permease [Paenibacillus sp. Cedars]EFU42923.1 binding-protein-dependent transport systems inner membrane component [Paenibacillus vortex V453]ETT40661.1 binding-protein-dependent transport system inner membrane protein [Paenibacillus sp. FSL R5